MIIPYVTEWVSIPVLGIALPRFSMRIWLQPWQMENKKSRVLFTIFDDIRLIIEAMTLKLTSLRQINSFLFNNVFRF